MAHSVRSVSTRLALALTVTLAAAANATADGGTQLVIHAARAVSPETGAVTEPAWLVVDNQKIASLGKTPPPGNQPIIELGDATLVPGLIDAHGHLLHSEAAQADAMVGEAISFSEADRALRGAWLAGQVLRAGFTTVRDLGNSGRGADVALQRAIVAGWVEGPRLLVSTRALAPPGGQFSRLAPTHRQLAEQEYATVRTPDEGTAAVVDALAEGADCIKVIVDVDSGRKLDAPVLEAIVKRAHAAHVKVAAHAVSAESGALAVAAGVDSIEHGYRLTDATLAAMAKRGVALVPTDYPESYYAQFAPAEPEPSRAATLALYAAFRKESADRLRRAVKARVPIVFGSDAYVPTPLGDRGREMGLVFQAYSEAGLSALEVLRAATSTSARVLDLGVGAGTLAPGAPADLIAVEGDVLKDVTALGRVRFVVKEGRVAFKK